MSTPDADTGVQGERSTPVVNTVRSVQSRISSILAASLMIALGLGALSWYYSNALSRQQRLRQAATTAAANSAQGEMALPPLGKVEPVNAGAPFAVTTEPASGAATPAQGAPGAFPPNALLTEVNRALELPLEQTHPGWSSTGSSGQPQRQGASDRRLAGVAFSRDSQQSNSPLPAEGTVPDNTGSLLQGHQGPSGSAGAGAEEPLAALLRPTVLHPTQAQMLGTQRFLLPKGAFIDCTLETAIDSTLPGLTTCVTATDTFGVDGKVVLLERGSKLVGETHGQVQNGMARVFVLWTEARTPTGVLVPLNSPGTDELGRSGLPGEVDRHFWDRFGAAMLISVIDGAMQAATQSATHGGGAIIYNPSTSQDALTEVLKGTINIAPTVIKHQGDRIQILVARDLDFRPVYELRGTGF